MKKKIQKALMGKCLLRELSDGVSRPLNCNFIHMTDLSLAEE